MSMNSFKYSAPFGFPQRAQGRLRVRPGASVPLGYGGMPTGVVFSFAAKELPRLAPALRFPVPPGGPSERYRGTENISMNSFKSSATTKESSLGAFKIGIQEVLGNFLGRSSIGSCGSVGPVAIPPIIGGVFLFAWCASVGSTALLFFFISFFGTLVQLGTCSVPTRALGSRAIRIVCGWLRCVSCTSPIVRGGGLGHSGVGPGKSTEHINTFLAL